MPNNLYLINNINNNLKLKLKLKLTDNINNIHYSIVNLLKEYHTYSNHDIFFQILVDEYQLLTFDKIIKFQHTYTENYRNDKFTTKYENVSFNNNILTINKNILLPIAPIIYQIGDNALYYYYLTIQDDLLINQEKTIAIIKPIGIWDIIDDKLYLSFQLEDFYVNKNKYNKNNVKTIFLFMDYGENIDIPKNHYGNFNNYNYLVIDFNNIDMNIINNYINNSDNIFIDSFKLYDSKTCYYDLGALPITIFIYNIGLLNLKINGNLFLYIGSYFLQNPCIELFYYIFSLFDKIEVLKHTLTIGRIGYFKFTNYNNKQNFNNIIEKYITYDKYLGQNLVINNIEPYYCTPKLTNKRKPNTNILIRSILNKNSIIDKHFLHFFNDVYNEHNKLIELHNKRITNINLNNIDSILCNNITKCIDFCKKYDIQINKLYDNYKPLNYNSIIKKYFPYKHNINMNNIQLSIDSIFSITKPELTIKIAKLINKYMSTVDYIIDGTSNIGSTTIVLSEYFKYIYAIEINNITFNNLKINIDVYKLNNVLPILDDITQFMTDNSKLKKINYDINKYCLFLDPPWDGSYYNIYDNVDLFLSNINILDFIKTIKIKYILLKVPFNYNFKKLYKYFENLILYKLKGFFVVLITK